MIRGGFIQGQLQELFKGQAIINLVFQFRIGVNAESLLQHEAFKKQQRRVGIGTFRAGADSIMAH